MPRISPETDVRAGRGRSSGIRIPLDRSVVLDGDLTLPEQATGVVIFAHGSGSSRLSSRNRMVAKSLNRARIGTLLFDLLTSEEEEAERFTRHLRFDVAMLTERLMQTSEWLRSQAHASSLPFGYFGASTGAAAALRAAALAPEGIAAVVSRGGRPDLAGELLERVSAPTLLIVGGADPVIIELNREAYAQLRAPKQLEMVPGATHLFEEPGALEKVSELATRWFAHHLTPYPQA